MTKKRYKEIAYPRLIRLDIIMFPLIVAIVFIHSSYPIYDTMGPNASFIRNFISLGIASVAVPVFFVRSGFLFFYGLEWSTARFFKKVQSRIVTILIPYLFWNLFAFVYMVVFWRVAGANTSQFWFIQELMLLIIMTPLFHILHKWAVPTLIGFLIVWLFFDWSLDFPVLSSSMPLLFFYAGTVLAAKKQTPFILDKWGWIFAIASIVLFAVDTLFNPLSLLLHNLGILFGLIGAFWLSKFMLNAKKLFLWLGSASFFVFAFHQPIMGRLIPLALVLSNARSDFDKLFYYFVIPLWMIAVGLCLFYLLRRLVPEILEIITGERTSKI